MVLFRSWLRLYCCCFVVRRKKTLSRQRLRRTSHLFTHQINRPLLRHAPHHVRNSARRHRQAKGAFPSNPHLSILSPLHLESCCSLFYLRLRAPPLMTSRTSCPLMMWYRLLGMRHLAFEWKLVVLSLSNVLNWFFFCLSFRRLFYWCNFYSCFIVAESSLLRPPLLDFRLRRVSLIASQTRQTSPSSTSFDFAMPRRRRNSEKKQTSNSSFDFVQNPHKYLCIYF